VPSAWSFVPDFMKFLLRLFHDQIILYGFYPLDAPYDFTRFIDGLLRINEAAQFFIAITPLRTFMVNG
jgi:hypothetical protein